MRNKAGNITILIGSLLSLAWIVCGVLIFSDLISFNYVWARGELGDYFGGGLGAISVLFIVYTVWLQIGQIDAQQKRVILLKVMMKMKELIKLVGKKWKQAKRNGDELCFQ